MDVLSRLQEDMKAAMKSGDRDRLSVIRMLLSDVKNIDLAPRPTTAEDAVAAYVKKLRNSLEEYEKIGKAEQADKLKFEIQVAESYLPAKASAEQTEQLVDGFLSKQSFTEKQFGQAMGAFMKAHGQNMDAALASQLLRKKLSGK